jgi:hypothetical protein
MSSINCIALVGAWSVKRGFKLVAWLGSIPMASVAVTAVLRLTSGLVVSIQLLEGQEKEKERNAAVEAMA